MTLPSFDKLAAHYDKGDAKVFKKRIGGGLTAAWLGENTCVMRVCEALNYAGKDSLVTEVTRCLIFI